MSTLLEFEGMPNFTLAFENTSTGGGTGTGYPIATQPEAEAGTTNTSLMTPLRTKQAVDFRIATEAEAIAGVSTTTLITPATLNAAATSVSTALWFFDKSGDLLEVTVPAGVDYIYRLGYAQRGDHEITRFKRKVVSPTVAPTNNLAWEKDATGVYFVNDMPRLDDRTMGVIATGQHMNGSASFATMTAGSNRVTLLGANFTAANVGDWIQVNGAGPLVENASGDGIWTDWLTGYIGTVVNVNIVDIVDAAGNPLNATQTVPTTEAASKTVYWSKDNTIALMNGQRAAATMGKFLYHPGGTNYALSLKSICGINGYNNIRIEGDGPTSRILHGTAQVAGDGFMFYIVGAIIDRTTITVPAPAGTDLITVGSLAGLAVDNYIVIRDKSQVITSLLDEEPNGLFLGWKGEIVRIREIVSSTAPFVIRLHAQTRFSYAASATAGQESDVRTLPAVENFTARNITLDLTKPMATTNCGIINALRVLRFTVDNVFFPHCSYGVTVNMAVDWIIRDSRWEWIGMVDGMQADGDHDKVKGYGAVVTGGSSNGMIRDCMARNVRHFCTASTGSDIPPMDVTMSGIVVSEGRNLIDTHPGADYWRINDCHVTGGMWVDEVDQFGYGFQIRGNFNEIIDCSASGVAIAIQVASVEGCRIHGFKGQFCEVGISLLGCRDIEVINPVIRECRNIGLYYHVAPSATEPLQRLGYCKIKGFRMTGNPSQKTIVEDYVCNLPCGMQFGYWNGVDTVSPPFTATFVSQWQPGITIEDWEMPDCVTPFVGADHEAVYGAGILDVATAQNMRCENVAAAGIAVLTSGTLFLSEIDLPLGRRIAKVGTLFASAPVAQTNLWFGLYDSNRNLMAKSADLLAVAPSISAVTLGTLDRTHVTQYKGRHYIGICQTAGTPSQVYGRGMATALAALGPATAGNSNSGLTGPASAPAISSATSTTLLTASLQYPVKKLTTQSGKAFTPGMRVRVALTASPTVDYFDGAVTSYSGTTLKVDCDWMTGLTALPPASLNAWTITADAAATAITATGNIAFVVTA